MNTPDSPQIIPNREVTFFPDDLLVERKIDDLPPIVADVPVYDFEYFARMLNANKDLVAAYDLQVLSAPSHSQLGHGQEGWVFGLKIGAQKLAIKLYALPAYSERLPDRDAVIKFLQSEKEVPVGYLLELVEQLNDRFPDQINGTTFKTLNQTAGFQVGHRVKPEYIDAPLGMMCSTQGDLIGYVMPLYEGKPSVVLDVEIDYPEMFKVRLGLRDSGVNVDTMDDRNNCIELDPTNSNGKPNVRYIDLDVADKFLEIPDLDNLPHGMRYVRRLPQETGPFIAQHEPLNGNKVLAPLDLITQNVSLISSRLDENDDSLGFEDMYTGKAIILDENKLDMVKKRKDVGYLNKGVDTLRKWAAANGIDESSILEYGLPTDYKNEVYLGIKNRKNKVNIDLRGARLKRGTINVADSNTLKYVESIGDQNFHFRIESDEVFISYTYKVSGTGYDEVWNISQILIDLTTGKSYGGLDVESAESYVTEMVELESHQQSTFLEAILGRVGIEVPISEDYRELKIAILNRLVQKAKEYQVVA